MFTEETLTEIRSRTDIVELIGEYVQLKKSGQSFKGLCPFHGEKTPSFHVQPLKQCFHCFGCHKGGNVFTFLCAIEGVTFPQAVQRLAKRAGVELREEFTPRKGEAKPNIPNEKRLLDALEWATRYFHYLLTQVPEYRFAREYVEGRGISAKTLEKFRIGVSPHGWNTLMQLMAKRGFNFQELVDCGLVVPKEDRPSEGYDRFRSRLMFPISDREGNVIGFGARILKEEENQPKYLNSPESPLFSKRKHLYGLFENQRGIRVRGEVLLVEGYMDVVGLYQAGVTNAVATMGTALTEEHGREIKSFASRVVTVFDPDSAGIEASRRSVSILMSSKLFAKDLSLPGGMDPDEFVQQSGAEVFYQLCEKAPRQITKYLKEIASQGPLSEEQVSKYLEELTPILTASRNSPDRATLWDDISLVLGVSREALKELSEGSTNKLRRPPGGHREGTSPPANRPVTGRPQPKASPPAISPIEIEFFQACVALPDHFLALPDELWRGGVENPHVATWLDRLGKAKNREEFEITLTQLVHSHSDSLLAERATAGLFEEEGKSPDAAYFESLLASLQKRKIEREIKALSAQVKLTQRLGNDAEQLKLLERLKQLRTSLRS